MPSALTAFAGGALFGLRCGTGDPEALLLHGWGRSSADLVAVAEPPSGEALPAISLDLPGFGASPAPGSAWGAAQYAEALVPLLTELGAPVVLVGHSFGGRVAVCLAAAHPELVRGLVLCGVPLLARDDRPASKPPLAYRALRLAVRWHLLPEAKLEAARRRHGSADYAAAQGVMREVLVRVVAERYEGELRALRCPVALVWGERDEDVPVSVARRSLELLHDGTLEIVAGASHDVVREQPGRVRAALDDLLARSAG